MKFFILGANGMVGHIVAMYLQEVGHEVLGYDEMPCPACDCLTGSLFDCERIERAIAARQYDAIINCAAVVNQDAENNKAAASFVNSYLPHFLETATAETNTAIVHRSTDCIFSGTRGNYTLNDMPDAISFYARTKVVGEINNNKDITVRTSLVGPELDSNGSGLFNWFYNQTGEVKGYANSIWTGLTTIEYAHVIEKLLMARVHGIVQVVPDYAISKYDLLKLFEKYYPSKRRILRFENDRVDKSLMPHFGSARLNIPNYEQMIVDMKNWTIKHDNLYQYN